MEQQGLDCKRWHVLCTYRPEDSEVMLRSQYRCQAAVGEPQFRYFVPYTFLSSHRPIALPENLAAGRSTGGHGRDGGGEEKVCVPRSGERVRRNNETRSALRRYIFIYADLQWLVHFLRGSWNSGEARIGFLSSRPMEADYVPDARMEAFIHTLSDMRLDFELTPSLQALHKDDLIRFKNHAFEGQDAYVVDYKRTEKGITLSVVIELVTNRLSLKIYNVREDEIFHVANASTAYANNNALVKRNQKCLMDILCRRINEKQTRATDLADLRQLDEVYSSRFRQFAAGEAATRRRFMAQMLMCACMRNDSQGKANYTNICLQELDDINSMPESKAATDVRARLHVALFVATGNPDYRRLARLYIQVHNPKSEKLRQLVRLVSKRAARSKVARLAQ